MPGDSNDISIGISLVGVETFRNQLREVTDAFRTLQGLGGSFGTGTAASLKGLTDNLSGFISGVNTAITRIGALNTAIAGVNGNIRQMNAGMGAVGGAGSAGSRPYPQFPMGNYPGAPVSNMGLPIPISHRTRQTLTDAERATRDTARALDKQQKAAARLIKKAEADAERAATRPPSSGGGGGRGGLHDMLYAGGFMLRYRAMSAGIEGARYAVQDVMMGKSREKIGVAAEMLAAVGLSNTERDQIERESLQLGKRLPGVSTEKSFKIGSEIGSAIDPKVLGPSGMNAGVKAGYVLGKMGKMPEDRAGRLIMSTYLGMAQTPSYKGLTPEQGINKTTADLAAAIQVSPMWAGDIEGFLSHAMPMVKNLGWDMPRALAFAGAGKTVGFKSNVLGRFTKTLMTDAGMDTMLSMYSAGAPENYGPLDSKDPRTQAWLSGRGITKPGQQRQVIDKIKAENREQMREMIKNDPFSAWVELHSRLQVARQRHVPESAMIKNKQWMGQFLGLGQEEFPKTFKDYEERGREIAKGGVGALEERFDPHKMNEIGSSYTLFSDSMGRLAESAAKLSPLSDMLLKFADAINRTSEKLQSSYADMDQTPEGKAATKERLLKAREKVEPGDVAGFRAAEKERQLITEYLDHPLNKVMSFEKFKNMSRFERGLHVDSSLKSGWENVEDMMYGEKPGKWDKYPLMFPQFDRKTGGLAPFSSPSGDELPGLGEVNRSRMVTSTPLLGQGTYPQYLAGRDEKLSFADSGPAQAASTTLSGPLTATGPVTITGNVTVNGQGAAASSPGASPGNYAQKTVIPNFATGP